MSIGKQLRQRTREYEAARIRTHTRKPRVMKGLHPGAPISRPPPPALPPQRITRCRSNMAAVRRMDGGAFSCRETYTTRSTSDGCR
ncbi:hypothetical protein Trydic_g68 [Trypoxylus dichotomus]